MSEEQLLMLSIASLISADNNSNEERKQTIKNLQ